MSLLFVALLGFVVPNGFFLYWLLFEFDGIGRVLQDKLALGFMLDVLLVSSFWASISRVARLVR
jgi:hypothetical protein